MDYEKKYKEALGKARQLCAYPTTKSFISDLQDLFPELAESEGEKVRKEIVRFIQMEVEDEIVGNKWLAWLGKQGQVKESTISQHEIETCKENNNSLTCEDERMRKEIINYFQCQSEEEPTRKEIHDKWIAWLENIPVIIDHEKREGFHLGYKACLEKQGTSYTKRDVDDAYVEGMAFAKDELEKQGEQNPAEWSEEDEHRLNSCLNILQPKTFVGNTETINTKWLKSLKGRVKPQWKPSETDITILEDVFNGKINPKDFQATLLNVLEQLKKLKEG